jgi:hypothetical protein
MLLPGSNLLLVGGLFLAGWLSGRLAYNRNEADYLATKSAEREERGGDTELLELPPSALRPEEPEATEESKKDA